MKEMSRAQIEALKALYPAGTRVQLWNADLETVPVYPCKDFYEYGEIVLDNELLEELREVPDEVYDWLTPEKGRARDGGARERRFH